MVRNTVEQELTVIFKEFLSDQVLKNSPLSRNVQHSTSENHVFVFNSERETESQPTPLFSFKIISEKLFHLKMFQKNHQARPQVYLNIAKVLDVSHKTAKALRKDMKGAIKPLHSTGIPSICSHRSQIVTFIYKRNTIMKKKIHLRLLQLFV